MPADREPRPDCLFCRIVRGELPAKTLVDDDLLLAFHDIAPRSPTHVLVIPKYHIPPAADLTEPDGALLGRMFATVGRIARESAMAADGSRMLSNVRRWVSMIVDHIQHHLMAGR